MALTLLALSSGFRFSKARGKFLFGGFIEISVVTEDRWRATLNASEGINFTGTGCPKSDISNRNATRAFFSSWVRYC